MYKSYKSKGEKIINPGFEREEKYEKTSKLKKLLLKLLKKRTN